MKYSSDSNTTVLIYTATVYVPEKPWVPIKVIISRDLSGVGHLLAMGKIKEMFNRGDYDIGFIPAENKVFKEPEAIKEPEKEIAKRFSVGEFRGLLSDLTGGQFGNR